MSEKVRWGIISTSNHAIKRVVPAIQASETSEVVAISSRDAAKAKSVADDLNIPKAYGSYDEVIHDSDVDVVFNPLPNSQHMKWSIACAEAGKPTLCEKPLASNADEAQEMVDAFATRDLLFAEAFMYRFHPQTQRVKEMVIEGAIGEIKAMQANFTFSLSDEGNVRLSKELVGGSLMDVGCYCINVMRFLTDEEPTQVKGISLVGDKSGVDESFSGVLSFPSGVVGHFDSSLRTYMAHSYEIRGTEGRISVREGFVMPKNSPTKIEWWREDLNGEIAIPAADSYQIMVEDFVDAFVNKRPPKFAPQDGVNNMKVIDALLASG